MSIVQVRAHQEGQYLSAPTSFRGSDEILNEWYKDAWQSEMLVYPPDYTGDITPQGWDTHSYTLCVDETGEQAQLMATGKLNTAQEAAETLARIRAATPEQARSIGTLATVNERNRSVFVASVLDRTTMAIGGIVLHVRPSKLRSLRDMFETMDVD